MFAWVMLAILGWSVLGALISLYEVGWALWFARTAPWELFAAILGAALGLWVCNTYLGWQLW